MSFCLNPVCPNPKNPPHSELCQACGSTLLLRDRYRIQAALGKGGFGATFLAIDEALPGHPNCVIKQLRPNATAPHILQMARELFEREAQTLGRIGNHPQVPRLLDYFEANKEFYLVQEYVSGATLQQEVKKNGPFSEPRVKHFLSEILPVLDYIHGVNVIHRDIKPANVIRRAQDDRLVLIDFGAVKYQDQHQVQNASEYTAFTSYAIGTPGFAPPEQMAMRPVPASDLYALGITCLYLLTGKAPKDMDYDPMTGELMWRKYVGIQTHFANVIQKMLEVSVRHRYQTAKDVFRDLDLEPYLDSLANSMLSKPANGNGSNGHGGGYGGGYGGGSGGRREMGDSGGKTSGRGNSPAARTAMAIRARQHSRSDSSGQLPSQLRPRGPDSRGGASAGGSRDLNSQGYNSRNNNRDNTRDNTRDSSRDTTGRDLTGSKPNPAIKRLDAEGLQTYYSKGKRDFASFDLHALSLPRVNLSGAVFHQGNLNHINLQHANLTSVDFGRANLSHANLRDANLNRAYLSNADLQGADLRGADLTHAYLQNANLRGANLCGANLTGAKLTEEQLAMARTNWMTVRPSGRRGMW